MANEGRRWRNEGKAGGDGGADSGRLCGQPQDGLMLNATTDRSDKRGERHVVVVDSEASACAATGSGLTLLHRDYVRRCYSCSPPPRASRPALLTTRRRSAWACSSRYTIRFFTSASCKTGKRTSGWSRTGNLSVS